MHTAVIAAPQTSCDPNSVFKTPTEVEQKARAIVASLALLLRRETMTLQNWQLLNGTESEAGQLRLGQIEANYMNKQIRQQKKPNVEFIKAFEHMPANVENEKQGGSW